MALSIVMTRHIDMSIVMTRHIDMSIVMTRHIDMSIVMTRRIDMLIYVVGALWSSDQSFWLQMQRSRVRFPALPDFLSSSGSGTGSTQPREVN